MKYARWGVCGAGAGWILAGAMAFAQGAAPASPPKTLSGSLGAGLSLTSGNTDTVNYNVAFELNINAGGKNTAKVTGQHLRGSQNGVLSVNRSALGLRDQYAFSPRGFVYGQIEYLRDTFKRLDYLIAPTAGAGYKVVDNATTALSVMGGLGVVTEADTGFRAHTSGALTAGQTLTHALSSTAKLTQSSTHLWKMDDLSDSLHTFAVGVSVAIGARTALGIDWLDTYKRRVPLPGIRRNDTALVASFTTKF